MTQKELEQIDFSKDKEIVNRATSILKEGGLNYWVIPELSNADKTYSRYTHFHSCQSLTNLEPGSQAIGTDLDIITHHYGGLAACVFDIFAYQVKGESMKTVSLEDVLEKMKHCYETYLDNVQPS